jgi:hypothetical protein
MILHLQQPSGSIDKSMKPLIFISFISIMILAMPVHAQQTRSGSKTKSQKPKNERYSQSHTVGNPSSEKASHPSPEHNSKPVEKLTWQLLEKYSPDGYFILDQFYKTPVSYDRLTLTGDNDFTKWIDGRKEEDVVKSLSTVVHEMDHGFNGRVYIKLMKDAGRPLDEGEFSAFYLGNKEIRIVKQTPVFPSKEIRSAYPKNLVTERYGIYIYPSESLLSSQQNGIYGLLDEWNAYYNGTKTGLDLYAYYHEKRNNAEGWSAFLSDYYGTYYAYLEFKSYILVYMMVAKDHHPDVYAELMKNKDLLYTLKKTDELWISLISHFKEDKNSIIKNLRARGMQVEESEDGYFYINGSGTGNFSGVYNKFRDELLKTKYQEMAHTLGFNSASGPEF